MHRQTSFGKPQACTDRSPLSFDVGKATLRQLGKFIGHTFGTTLPDDDWGRDVIFELLNQQALNGFSPHMMRRYAINLLPEIGDDDSLDNTLQDIGGGTRRNADDLARRIGRDLKTRELLEITCIGAGDCPKLERMAIKAQLYAANKKWKREKERMARAATGEPAPKAAPSRRKRRKKATGKRGRPSLGAPWNAEGISRATWFRHRERPPRETKIGERETKIGETKIDRSGTIAPTLKRQQTQRDGNRRRDTKIGARQNGG
ncbi:hypothetical protein [Bradyrhizobium sp. Ash2021]|uniref:hypothetical protein n=1 Tax=Bradyrhizobium sp. Ash2021 TaxID=2954771 RepID=UPI002814B308|nr:hypothetical protein [Bradyrhizobium sp. Ash2021]WMT79500.1 hypothetical protein NL528_46475 [Bradyrhizobium sp. Ash2021]